MRVKFLAEELRLLFSAFPHLRDAFDPDELPIDFILKTGSTTLATAPPNKRKRMSPAARRAAAERMRQYWASRRAGGDK